MNFSGIPSAGEHDRPLHSGSGHDRFHREQPKIKILFLMDKLAPGGTQNNILEILNRLDPLRFDCRLAVFGLGAEARWFLEKSKIVPIVLPVRRAYGMSGFKAFMKLCAIMRREKFDWVQTHFLQAEMLGIPAARLAGRSTRIAVTRRDQGFWRTPRQLRLSAWLARAADVVLCNSEAVRSSVLQLEGVPKAKTAVIRNGVDTQAFCPSREFRMEARQAFKLQEGEIAVLTVSNMRHEVKGYQTLIEAAGHVLSVNPQVRFIFAGDGPLRPEYERLADEAGSRGRIIFAGTSREISRLMNAADVVCQPSYSEGFSNTLLEAMACAKPVVACSAGGNTEVLEDSVQGLLVPPRDADALAQAILRLASDSAFRESLGRAAREKVSADFSMHEMMRNYANFYASGDAL
ncbi:MAG: glycosyltransferase [Candidatus Omnitrophica bacterium]|nr:glycosyltransferase [Candidatus Omnitrophota bacterium]